MNQTSKIVEDKKINKGLLVIVIFMMYITDSLFFAINADQDVQLLKRISVFAFAILMMAFYILFQHRKISAHIVFVTISIFISSLLAGFLFTGFYYYTFIACIWIGYIFSRYYSMVEFSSTFCLIMKIIAVLSLVVFVFRTQVIELNLFPIVTSAKNQEYIFLGVTSIPLKIHQSVRNYGPFWEPGTYQIYLNLALFFTLFVENTKLSKKLINSTIFIVTGFSTLSGGFLIPMCLIVIAIVVEKKNIKALMGVFLLIAVMIVLLNTGSISIMLEKITGENSTNSLIYRWIGIEGGIRGFLHNPLFGSSPFVNDSIKQELAFKYLGDSYASDANTFMNLFAYFGIYVGGFIVVSSYKMFASIGVNRMSTIILFCAFILLTSNENLTTSLIFMVICMLRYPICNEDDTAEVLKKQRG